MSRQLVIEIIYLVVITACILMISIEAFGRPFETIIRKAAVEQGVDPDLAMAIATVESGLDHKKVGSSGEQGIFQLHPKFHETHVNNVPRHITAAIAYLSEIKRKCTLKYGAAYFVCYAYGPNSNLQAPTETTYYKRVIERLPYGTK